MGNLWKVGAAFILLLLTTMSAAAAPLAPTESAELAQTEQSTSADVRVIPRDGAQGGSHTILVSGLNDGENITIRILQDSTGDSVFVSEQTADANGRVELSIFTTQDDEPGTYTIEVLNLSEEVIGSTALTILEPQGRVGSVSVSPELAEAGEAFMIEIRDARPFASLDVVVRDEGLLPIFRASVRADVDGMATVEFPSARDLGGVYTVTVTEGENTIAQGEFEISARESLVEITVQPQEADPGAAVIVSVSGLEAEATVQLEISFSGVVILSEMVTADVNGNVIYRLETDAAAAGEYSVAVLADGEVLAQAAYTVTGDAVEITLEDGVEGEPLLISVTGLNASEEVTIEVLDGAEVLQSVPATADVNGNVIVNIPAEDAPGAGDYDVRVLRGETPIAAVSLTIVREAAAGDVVIQTTREALRIGDSFLVRVSGLEPGETVTFEVRYEGETVFSTERTADGSGAFSIELSSGEGDEPGQYELIVVRDGEEAAATLLTISDADEQITEEDVSVAAVPASVAPGESFTLTVLGLQPGETVTLDIRFDGESVFTTERVVGENGSVELRLTAEETDEPGDYEVIVLRDDEALAAGTFSITEETTTQTTPDVEGDVAIDIQPESFQQGEGFTVTISGLDADETVTVDVRYEGESVFSTERAADENGVIELILTSTADDEAGDYEVIVVRDDEQIATESFTITAGDETPGEEPAENVTVVVNPSTSAQGEEITVTVSGLQPDETVTLDILYDGESVFAAERTANENGRITLNLVSSEDDEPGRYVVVVERDGAQVGAGSFTLTAAGEETPPEPVTEAEITIDPASGPLGTQHQVTVTGLEPGETVQLQVLFDGEEDFSTEVTADENGTVSLSLVGEEGDPAGDYTVNILRGEDVIASGVITIEETATTQPDPGGEPGDEEPPAAAESTSQITSGRLTTDMPEERVTFSGESGETVLISLNSPDFDTFLVLLDDQGNQLELNDDSNQSLNSQIGPYELPYTGEYTVVVSSYAFFNFGEVVTGAYELVIERVALSEIAYGETVDVSITEETFTQFFTFEAAAGDVISVTVDSGGSVDTVLSLIDPDGFTVLTDDDGGSGFDPEVIRYVIPASGTYTLTLRAFTPGTTGSASLTVNLNDQRTLDEETRTVILNAKQNRDVLTLSGEAGEAIQLTIRVEDGAPGDLTVSAVQDGISLMFYQAFGIPSEITLGFVIPSDGEVTIFIDELSGAASALEVSIERE